MSNSDTNFIHVHLRLDESDYQELETIFGYGNVNKAIRNIISDFLDQVADQPNDVIRGRYADRD